MGALVRYNPKTVTAKGPGYGVGLPNEPAIPLSSRDFARLKLLDKGAIQSGVTDHTMTYGYGYAHARGLAGANEDATGTQYSVFKYEGKFGIAPTDWVNESWIRASHNPTSSSVNPGGNPKPVSEMSAAEINRENDKLSVVSSKLTDEMIAAGRGHERPSEYLKMSDPLAMKLRTLYERKSEISNEIERRAGPGMYSLPIGRGRGFGPMKHNNPAELVRVGRDINHPTAPWTIIGVKSHTVFGRYSHQHMAEEEVERQNRDAEYNNSWRDRVDTSLGSGVGRRNPETITFKGGFGEYSADTSAGIATIRTEGFGRIKRYKVWVGGGIPIGQFNTLQDAKRQVQSVVRSRGGSGVRSNPEDSAAALYEEFHGRPSDETTEYVEDLHYHSNLTQLGELTEMKIATVTGLDVTLSFDGCGTQLSSNEDGTQLYFTGGDQSVDLTAFKMDGSEWLKDSMLLGVLYCVTYRTEKGFDKFKLTDYYHDVGEETGVQPVLLYDTLNSNLSVSGGQYQVKDVGIVN